MRRVCAWFLVLSQTVLGLKTGGVSRLSFIESAKKGTKITKIISISSESDPLMSRVAPSTPQVVAGRLHRRRARSRQLHAHVTRASSESSSEEPGKRINTPMEPLNPWTEEDVQRAFVPDGEPTWRIVARRFWSRWGPVVVLLLGSSMAYSGVRLGKRVHASRGTAQPAQVQTSKTSSEQSPAPSKREAPAAPRRNVVYADYPVEEMVEVLGYHRVEYLRPECAAALKAMLSAASAEGIELVLVSGFRSYEEQRVLQASAQERVSRGNTDEIDVGTRAAGRSEHHTGLAVDLCEASSADRGPGDDLAYSRAYLWLLRNARAYGFTQGSDYVNKRPWHWRYEGDEPSRAVFSNK